MRDNLQWVTPQPILGPRPRRGRNLPLCELPSGIGLWKVPQLWKSATQRADSHSCLNGPLHNARPIHTYTQARRFIHIRGGIIR